MNTQEQLSEPTLRGFLITTKFHGPTDFKGSRYSASCCYHGDKIFRVYINQGRFTNDPIHWHRSAAQKLIDKYLNTTEILGGIHDATGEDLRDIFRITGFAFNDPDANYWLVCRDFWVQKSVKELADFYQQLPAVQS